MTHAMLPYALWMNIASSIATGIQMKIYAHLEPIPIFFGYKTRRR